MAQISNSIPQLVKNQEKLANVLENILLPSLDTQQKQQDEIHNNLIAQLIDVKATLNQLLVEKENNKKSSSSSCPESYNNMQNSMKNEKVSFDTIYKKHFSSEQLLYFFGNVTKATYELIRYVQ
jgi:hypothetical protein